MQYGKWLWRALHGDLGLSPIVHKPVMDLLLPKFGNTLILAGASFFLAVVLLEKAIVRWKPETPPT